MAEQHTQTKEVKNLVKFHLPEVLPFNDVISTLTLTSSSLETMISQLMTSVFKDFEGCKIFHTGIAGQEVLKCKLYFKPCMNKDDGLYAVKVRGEDFGPNKGNAYSVAELVRNVNMISKSKKFDLEDIAKELLAEFIYTQDAKTVKRFDADTKKEVNLRLPANWNPYIEEVTDPVGNTRFQNPYLAVNLDLLPMVSKLYGKKDPVEVAEFAKRNAIPKDCYQYHVGIVKVLNIKMQTYVLEIRKIDIKEMERLAQSIGFGNVTGNIIMTRA